MKADRFRVIPNSSLQYYTVFLAQGKAVGMAVLVGPSLWFRLKYLNYYWMDYHESTDIHGEYKVILVAAPPATQFLSSDIGKKFDLNIK